MQLSALRRSFSPLAVFSLFCLLFSTASAAVLGIDLGTEYIKAALVKPGIPLDIVLTKDSKRKEATAITFKPIKQKSSSDKGVFPERAYGSDAVALSARFPGNSFMNIKSLLGIPATDGAVERYVQRYPGAVVVPEPSRGTVSLRSQTFDETENPFEVEELLAMQLQNVAANAANMAGSKIRDVVITVPVYWTVEEKDALRSAAELAGLQVLSLTTDGLAVGLNYAMTRTFPVVNDGGKAKPEYHIVYDMGAGGTTATVLRMQGRTVKDVGRFNKTVQEVQVAGIGWDKTLGGDALNTLIMNDMIDKLAENKKIKALGATREMVAKDARTASSLWRESERLRQVLSANTETQASFESIYNEDVLFKYKIKRSEFEKMAADYVQRVKSPIDQAMHSARVEFSDIESIIVHGGAQRTPFVQKALEGAIGKGDKVRNNVNADEAAAFGAAFLGASLSPTFRVKQIHTSEAGIHDVWVSWDQDRKEKKQKIFTDISQSGVPKQLPFNKLDDFSFEIFQQALDGDNMRNVPVWTVQTTNLTNAVKKLTESNGCPVEDVSTQFEVLLSPVDNLPEVVRGTVSCEVIDDSKKGGIVDGIKGLFGGKKDDQKVLKDESAKDDSKAADSSSGSSSSSASSETKEAEASASADSEKSSESKKKTVKVYVGVLTESTKRKQKISHMELQRMETRLADFKKSDEGRAKRAEALNKLEAYTYRVRDMLENDEFIASSTEKQRKAISEKSSEASEWIYGDGSEAPTSEFKKRLDDLKTLVEPIEKRKEEAAKRPEEIKKLEDFVESTRKMLESLKSNAESSWKEYASSTSAAAASASASETAPKDELDELDDDPSSAAPADIAEPAFSPEDFDSGLETVDKVDKWLKENLAAQAKLSPSDDPAFLIKDISKEHDKLLTLTGDVLNKQLEAQRNAGKPKKKKSSSKSKSKTTTAKSSKTSKGKTSSTTAASSEGTEKASSSKKDEL